MEACSELGLKEYELAELSFTQRKWHINLQWDSGHVYFTSEWLNFIEESSIEVGDLCVLRYTSSCQQFEVVIFDKLGMDNFNHSGNFPNGKLNCLYLLFVVFLLSINIIFIF